MSDLHTPPFFGALLRDQGCDQRHNDSIAKIVQIQDDDDPPATERFEQIERQTQEVCGERGSGRPGCADAREILAGIGGASRSAGTLQRVTRSMNAELEKLPSERQTRIPVRGGHSGRRPQRFGVP